MLNLTADFWVVSLYRYALFALCVVKFSSAVKPNDFNEI
jgi:hypothetical protein